jgi:hypothetical protein
LIEQMATGFPQPVALLCLTVKKLAYGIVPQLGTAPP